MVDQMFGSKGWTPERVDSLAGKIFVITGTTAGTGFEAARFLASKNAKVIMLNRNPEKATRVQECLEKEIGPNADFTNIQMDLSILQSVRVAATKILKIAPRIDALICNAAIAQVPKHRITVDGFECHIGTNYYGHFVLCSSLFERIEQSKGRIVVVSSLGYKMGLRTIQFDDINWEKSYKPNPVYCHSKLAQMMMAYELQDRIKAANKFSKAYVCHPGASATSLISTSGGALINFIWSLMKLSPFVQSAEKGAYSQIMCATEENLEQRAFYGPTGPMEAVGPVGAGTLETYAFEKKVMSKLWEVTEQITDSRWDV